MLEYQLLHRTQSKKWILIISWRRNVMETDLGNKTIGLKRDADLTKRDNWDEYLDWLTDMTIKFRKTFSKRVKSLDLTKRIDGELPTVRA